MKQLILLSALLAVAACNAPQKNVGNKKDTTAAVVNTDTVAEQPKELVQYTEAQLVTFLDSIGAMDNSVLRTLIDKPTDSLFRANPQLVKKVAGADYAELKKVLLFQQEEHCCGDLDMAVAKRIFAYPIDTFHIKDNKVSLELISFDKKAAELNEYAVSLGSGYGAEWENDLYFFKHDSLIAYHHNYHKNAGDVKHYKDADGKTVVYYCENFGSGTGIWQYNYYFYKYEGATLRPVLNLLQNGNLNNWGLPRDFWMETFVKKTNPLTIKFEYNYQLAGEHGEMMDIMKRVATVQYKYDEQSKSYKGVFNSGLREDEIYCYHLADNEVYTTNVYYKDLKALLNGKNKKKRETVLIYLNAVKNGVNSTMF